ncbi:MAG: potassium transporter Kup [Hyphomicrobiaceae bacterium]
MVLPARRHEVRRHGRLTAVAHPASQSSHGPGADAPHVAPTAGSDARRFAALTVGTIGVVYGDIGTSPLYAFKEAVAAASGGAGLVPQPSAVLGILSLIVWALIIIVSIKYVLILLRADNNGEGGTLALMALVQKSAAGSGFPVLMLGAIGAALFYGDALITPAISVLSAIEGLKLALPVTNGEILLATVAILVLLFAVQSHGTHRVAAAFGPIMLLWFGAIGTAGAYQIAQNPEVLVAINPLYAVKFLTTSGMIGLVTLGAVFLAVTGAEALYADLGHFGRKPVTVAWFGLVLPSLVINYFGQGALVLAQPSAIENPFYRMVPENLLIPLIGLATIATIIASQATITGAFSLTRQAIQLGLLPRLSVRHTSEAHAGQIYLPHVNWIMLGGVLILVLTFRSSEHLASAYGIAVTGTMIVTAMLASFMMRTRWEWSPLAIAAVMAPFLVIDLVFLGANLLKLFEGGWVTLLVGAIMLAVMLVWWKGTRILAAKTRRSEISLESVMADIEKSRVATVPGTGVYLTAHPYNAPTALLHTMKHFKVVHERVVILSVITSEWPHLTMPESVAIEHLSERFVRVRVVTGFMQQPNIPEVLAYCRGHGLPNNIMSTSFLLARRSLKADKPSSMPMPATAIYIALASNAADATDYFRIPKDRAVEIGTQVGL